MQTTPGPNENLSMLNFLYGLFQALGGFESTFDARGERLRSYEAKRDFFNDVMINNLLSAFAGNHKFEEEKINDPQRYEQTKETFNYLLERIEEIIFFMQREYDQDLYDKTLFPGRHYAYVIMVIVSEKLAMNREQYVKTCPLIYLNQCVLDVVNNEFDVSKTIKNTVGKYLDNLRSDHPKSSIAMYEELNKIDENKNYSKSLYTVSTEVKQLRENLEGIFPDGLNQQQNGLIQELHGIYNCLLALSRFRFDFQPFLHHMPPKNIDLLREYVEFSAAIHSSIKKANTKELISYKEERLDNDGSREAFMLNMYIGWYNYIWNNQKCSNKTHNALNNFEEIYGGVFITLEYINSAKIENLCFQFNSFLSAYLDVSKIIDCLQYIKTNNKEEAIESISNFLRNIETVPYSLRKFACTLYIGLILSNGFKITPNALAKYINIYLETSLPSFKLFLTDDIESNEQFIRKAEKNNYDFNSGLLGIIKEYNQFVISNELDLNKFLVNPLININAFLDKFFISFYSNCDVMDELKRSEKSLKGLKTLLTKAKIPLINFSVLDLKDAFIVDQLGLFVGGDGSQLGCEAIYCFIDLPLPTREAILTACKSILDE